MCKYMENPPLWYCWHHVTVGKFIHVTLTWESRDAHVTWTCHLYRDTRYFWRHNFPFGRGKMATADFRGHKRTILWKILCDFHVTARPKVYWVVRRVFFGQQSFLFESFCVPVSPFSPMILMKTLASVPAHSTSPVVTSISNVDLIYKSI